MLLYRCTWPKGLLPPYAARYRDAQEGARKWGKPPDPSVWDLAGGGGPKCDTIEPAPESYRRGAHRSGVVSTAVACGTPGTTGQAEKLGGSLSKIRKAMRGNLRSAPSSQIGSNRTRRLHSLGPSRVLTSQPPPDRSPFSRQSGSPLGGSHRPFLPLNTTLLSRTRRKSHWKSSCPGLAPPSPWVSILRTKSSPQYGVVSGMDAATKKVSAERSSQTRAVPCRVLMRTLGVP